MKNPAVSRTEVNRKLLNALCMITPLLAYLEWGSGSNMFLLKAEMEIFSKLFTDPVSVLHPLTILPVFGQAVLLFTLFQQRVSRKLTLTGIFSIAILMLLIFAIGIMSLKARIILSTLPFLITGTVTVIHHVKTRS